MSEKIARLEEEIRSLKRKLHVAERLRFDAIKSQQMNTDDVSQNSQLLAMGIAHEFNNILGAAEGHAEWALESQKSEDMNDALEAVVKACQKSSAITRALKGLLQPREEAKDIFLLDNIFVELEKLFERRFIEEGVSFNWGSTKARIYGDSNQVFEVVLNLVKNAFESVISVDSSSKSIDVSFVVKDKIIQLLFADDGLGVSEGQKPFIFQPFFTSKGELSAALGESSQSKIPKGLGLGLFFSRMIVAEHGGKLFLQSSKKEKTVFVLELPLA